MIFTAMLDRFSSRSSLENPNTPLSAPDDWLFNAFGATRSKSGMRVSRESALTYSAVWRGVNLLSRDVGKLPIVVYRRQGEGKERAIEHPAYNLLRYKPNAEMTAFIVKQLLTFHAILCGNGYAYIRRRGDGAPLELIPLNPDETYPVRENGTLIYINKIGLRWEPIRSADVLHIKGLGFDGLCGYSVIQKARDSFGLGLAMQEYSSRFFSNNATPSIVIEVAGAMPPNAQREFLEQWNQMNQGLANAHGTAIITHGGKAHELSKNARESQLSELRTHELREVANWLGLAPHKVGDTTRTAYASLEQENQSHLDEGLDPWLVNWEEECRDKLLTEAEKRDDSHVIEFMRQALIRANMTDRGAFYSTALQGGWMNRDEVRARENMNPLPDDEGKRFYIPLNMQLTGEDSAATDGAVVTDNVQATALNGAQVESLLSIVEQVTTGTLDKASAKAIIKAAFPEFSEATVNAIIDPLEIKEPPPMPTSAPSPADGGALPTTPEPPIADDDDDLERSIAGIRRTIVVDAARRMVKRLGVHARKAARKPDEFLAWLDSLEDDHRATVTEALTPGIRLCAATLGRDVPPGSIVDGLFVDLRSQLLELSGTCTADQLGAGVEACMARYETSAPETLADKVIEGVNL